MDRQAEFERAFRAQIERFRDPLRDGLRKLRRVKPPAGAAFVMFEIYSDWRSFPISSFAFDRRGNEVSVDTPFHGSRLAIRGELIPGGVIDQDAFEEDGVATFESGARILAELFRQCWQAAGGEGFSLPAYIKHHDRGTALDLRTGEWVSTKSLWG
ncbi:unnamed protein product [uncultured bacterium]|nr:unnamed protein product [uncultured bacterium]